MAAALSAWRLFREWLTDLYDDIDHRLHNERRSWWEED